MPAALVAYSLEGARAPREMSGTSGGPPRGFATRNAAASLIFRRLGFSETGEASADEARAFVLERETWLGRHGNAAVDPQARESTA